MLLAMSGQLGFNRLIVFQMRSHQALPEPVVIGHEEIQQLMNDHIVPERLVQAKQIGIEIQVTARGT